MYIYIFKYIYMYLNIYICIYIYIYNIHMYVQIYVHMWMMMPVDSPRWCFPTCSNQVLLYTMRLPLADPRLEDLPISEL